MKRLLIFCLLAALAICACQVSVSPLPTAQLVTPQGEPSLTPTMSPEPGPPDENIPGQVRGRLVESMARRWRASI